jgi:4-amino-4-deoxy-L-arabinose transferase-like glycosyltransferase
LTRRLLLAVLLVAALCPYFINLGASSIWDANEAFYVETPREMIERADYVFPTFNYEPRLNKPVLSYWIVAAFYTVFGVSVTAQRLAITLGALVIIATAFGLAFAASPRTHGGLDLNERLHHSPLVAALWAALGVAIGPRMLMFARRIFIDIYIAMFMGLTLLFFALSERFPERRRLFMLLMYVSVGLGVLTKGPVAALLPGLVFALYLLAHRELGRTKDMMLPLGTLIVRRSSCPGIPRSTCGTAGLTSGRSSWARTWPGTPKGWAWNRIAGRSSICR